MSKIKFYEKSHRYKYGRDELTSCTTFVKKFFPMFDAKKKARFLASLGWAKRQKKGVRYWLSDWKGKGEHGTRVHNAIEEYINTGDALCCLETYCTEDRDINKFNTWLKWWTNLNKEDVVSEISEELIYDLDINIAGTIDYNAVTIKGKTNLMDWKTNTDFTKIYDEDFAFNPIQHLENNKLSQYNLQLSLYAYMLERKGAKIGDLIIVEIGEDKVKEHKVEYLKKEVMEMIEYGKKTN